MLTFRKIQVFVLAFLFLIQGIFATAQPPLPDFCTIHEIDGISWSPNGKMLAVITLQGAFIYGHDMQLVRSIEAPVFADHLSRIQTTPRWSPDSTWVTFPQRKALELNMGGNFWTIFNVETNELTITSPASNTDEIVWSPDNKKIVTMNYAEGWGLDPSQTTFSLSDGIAKTYDDVRFANLQWVDSETFSAQIENVTIFFDIATLEPKDRAPIIKPRWWVSSPDGTYEAAYKPDLILYVREQDGEEQPVVISHTLDSDREVFSMGFVHEIEWLPDNRQFIGIYERYPGYDSEVNQNFSTVLQGIVVDASTAAETNYFYIQTADEITHYTLSAQGDRIAVAHSDSVIEIWNPLTGEHLKTIDVPTFLLQELCTS